MQENKSAIRATVRGMYDMQQLRIQAGNRIVANFRSKLGIEAGEADTETDKEAEKLLNTLRAEYKLLTEGVNRITRRMNLEAGEYIDSHTEIRLIQQYERLVQAEDAAEKTLEDLLDEAPIYTQFLAHIRGISTKMASVIISEIDIHKAKYPSSIWKYAGLDVVDGEGRSRKKRHLEEREYTNKYGEKEIRQSLTYNPFLKTKLIGVLGQNLIRSEGHYKGEFYNPKKHFYMTRGFCNGSHSETGQTTFIPSGKATRQENDYCTKGHCHAMARRYMVKMFLLDLYKAWRTLEDLPVSDSYHSGQRGHDHSGDDDDDDDDE